jgi:phospholipid-binding lipoprotein MlaA
MKPIQRPTKKGIPALAISIALLGAVGGCATGPDRNPSDPLEKFNRATFRFNDALDRNVAKPLAEGYDKVTPRPLQIMVTNFFANLGDVPVMLNEFLQGRGGDGLSDMMRIATNTVFGLGGVIDIATPAGLQKHDQDFGLTLGHWGVPSGPYLVLPLFGPSTFRDATGFGVDQQANPTNYVDVALRNSLWGLNFVSTRARYLGATDLLEAAALDKYTFTRDAYLARRRYRLTEEEDEALPTYDTGAAPANEAGEAAPAGQPAAKPDATAPAGKPAEKPAEKPGDNKPAAPAAGQ